MIKIQFLRHLFVIAFVSILLHVVSASEICEQDLELLREKRLGAIKNQILSKLNMTEAPPNPVQPRVLGPEVWDAYNVITEAFKRDAMARAAGCVDNNYFARKVTLITPEVQAPPLTSRTSQSPSSVTTENDNVFYGGSQEGQNLSFSVQLPTGSSNEVDYAEVRLRKACSDVDFPGQYETLCYAYTNENTPLIYANVEIYLHLATDHGTTRKVFVTGRPIILNDGKMWEEFTITEALRQCLDGQQYKTMLNLELEIKLDPSNDNSIDPYAFFQNSVASLTNTTQLVIFTVNERDVENARRRKRQVTKEFCFSTNTSNCCVRNLTINFHEDLNWTWVIAPIEYTPNYCSGGCPYLWPSATPHAEALQTLKFLNPAASAEPCCVPALLLPLTIIREDESGNLIFEPLSEMIVESCHCR